MRTLIHLKLYPFIIHRTRKTRTMVSSFTRVWRGWVPVDHPWKVIIIGLSVALVLIAGCLRFKPQYQNERLYFPDHSKSREDLARSMKSFPNKGKADEFIITMEDGVSSVLNNSKALKLALKIHKHIMAETGIESVCIKSNNGGGYTKPCFISSALELFHCNESFITDDQIRPIILESLNNDKLILANGRNTKMSIRGQLGRFRHDAQQNTIYAAAIRVRYYNVFPETDDVYNRLSAFHKKFIDLLLWR